MPSVHHKLQFGQKSDRYFLAKCHNVRFCSSCSNRLFISLLLFKFSIMCHDSVAQLKRSDLLSSSLPAEPEAYLRRDPADRRAAQHGEGGDPGLVLQPPAERETHQSQQCHPSPAQPAPHCPTYAQTALLQPSHGKYSTQAQMHGSMFPVCVLINIR